MGPEQLVTGTRDAARLLDMHPSSIRDWVRTGKLGPAPWTREQLEAVKLRPDAPVRRRGSRSPHGTLSRVNAGCLCDQCRIASAAAQKERERLEAEQRFPPSTRDRLLRVLTEGVTFPSAVAELGLNANQVWGRARVDPIWGGRLQQTLDAHRPSNQQHGTRGAYVNGCRCTECRTTGRTKTPAGTTTRDPIRVS